ncbi:MAG: ribosome-associated translation inhibitor RaiA [Acidobacteriota bacterium]|jgi:putative sigma-54 modulation protein|nr:ribosome-associated translation inhibitor RaiA [Acidobacteriota bacterium]
MKVEITGRHIEVTPAIRTYIQKKLGKFTRILGDDINFHVVVGVEKERQNVEILLKSRLLELAGKGSSNDLYNSVILAIEKLERQALKQKGKMIEGKRQKAAREKSVAIQADADAPVPRTVKRKSAKVREEALRKKPMTIEEAVLELEQAEYPFVVFRNSESDEMNVVYRHKKGAIRVIRGE